MKNHVTRFVSASILALAPAALADQSVSIPSSADNTLYESATGALSNGAGSTMFVGRTGQASNSRRRGLVTFDLAASLPAGVTITGATVRLYQDGSNSSSRMVGLHRVLQAWGEGASNSDSSGGAGVAATPGDATWLHTSFPGALWSAAGGSFAGPASATTSVGGVGFWEWSSAGLVADVQAMLDGPADNFGWLLLGDESVSSTAKRFATRESSSLDRRPVLIVTYVPTPGAASVLAMAVALGARRRGRIN